MPTRIESRSGTRSSGQTDPEEDTDNRGVSDPAGGPGDAFALHERGRSRPVSCSDITDGRERAAQYAALSKRHTVRQHLHLLAVKAPGLREPLIQVVCALCDSEGREGPTA